jgi:hypothetical protein
VPLEEHELLLLPLSTLYSLFSFSFSLVFFTLLVDPLKELERIQILGVAILHG